MSQTRLDAVESVFFKRQLETIDARVYDTKYPEYKARRLLPTQDGVDPTSKVYTYRMFDTFGSAKWIGNMSDDLPRAEASGAEASTIIHPMGASYGYSVYDIRAAAKMGTPLDSLKAMGARRAIEEKIDLALSLGDSSVNVKGLLTLSSTTSYTPVTKAAGGTTWGTLSAPNATPDEVARDLMGICNKVFETTKGTFNRFRILLPNEQYNYAATIRLGDGSDVTALKFALATSPYIESIEPWIRCDASLSNSALTYDRMIAYPYSSEVVAAIVPEEFTLHTPEQRNLEYVINATASTGGVVCRYPMAIGYGDNI
jgi:hypothetical protein